MSWAFNVRLAKLKENEASDDRIDFYRTLLERGEVAADDLEPIFPHIASRAFNVFWELHAERGSNGFAPDRISYHSIDCYCRLMKVELEPWEIQSIRQADDVMLKAMRMADKQEAGKAQAKAVKGKR